MDGWIKIHRKITNWEWYDDYNTFRLFIHLLLEANHKDKKYRGMDLKAGTVITGRQMLAKSTGLTVQQVRTALEKLQSTNEITIKTSSQGTIIQVVKYEDYQLATSKVTNEQPTSNQRVTTNKKEKKEKKEKNIDIDKFLGWFNNEKQKRTGTEGKFKRLTLTDQNNLEKLKDSYTNDEFNYALNNLYLSKWAEDNNMRTPSHFLRVENFNKYLNQEDKQNYNPNF
jgi:hypothetical protein